MERSTLAYAGVAIDVKELRLQSLPVIGGRGVIGVMGPPYW
jgi:hypothetical protein